VMTYFIRGPVVASMITTRTSISVILCVVCYVSCVVCYALLLKYGMCFIVVFLLL